MAILHKQSVLEKSCMKALSTNRGMFFKTVRIFLFSLIVIIVVSIFLSIYLPSKNIIISKQTLEKSLQKAKEQGAVIKNIKYINGNKNTFVKSQSAIQTESGLELYSVNAVVDDGNGKIKTDKAVIDKKTGELSSTGNVKYNNKDGVVIKSDGLVVDSKTNNVKGNGNVSITKDNVDITGEQFEYSADDKKIKVKGSVKIIIKQ